MCWRMTTTPPMMRTWIVCRSRSITQPGPPHCAGGPGFFPHACSARVSSGQGRDIAAYVSVPSLYLSLAYAPNLFHAWLARIVRCIRMRSRQETEEPAPLNGGHLIPQRKKVLCKSNRLLNRCPRRNPSTNHISHNRCRLRLQAGSPRISLHHLHRHPGNQAHPLASSASVSCSSPLLLPWLPWLIRQAGTALPARRKPSS
jgi:hypothetical protein